MLFEAMKALGARSDQSVIIGDAVCDMQMGRAADILSFGVGWGCPPPAELDAAGAHEVHNDFPGLGRGLERFSNRVIA